MVLGPAELEAQRLYGVFVAPWGLQSHRACREGLLRVLQLGVYVVSCRFHDSGDRGKKQDKHGRNLLCGTSNPVPDPSWTSIIPFRFHNLN